MFDRISSFLDLVDLLSLRSSSSYLVLAVERHLHSSLVDLSSSFTPRPRELLSALDWSRGYICGTVAVAFLCRIPPHIWTTSALDVVLPCDEGFNAFLFHLLICQGGRIASTHHQTVEEADDSQYLCRAWAQVRTTKGVINLYQSPTFDPLLPVTRSTLSVQMAYVSLDRFGTAYPRMLFKQRSLLGELHRAFSPAIQAYRKRGFSVKLFVDAWPDRKEDGRCAAYQGECPAQIRSFCDVYSLCATANPLRVEPLSTTVAWRLDSRPCDGPCLLYSWSLLTFVLADE